MVNYISDDQYNLPIADRQEHLFVRHERSYFKTIVDVQG